MKSLQNQIAALESKLDYFETEFNHLDLLLKKCGFSQGIQTLKDSAKELLEEELLEKHISAKKSKS